MATQEDEDFEKWLNSQQSPDLQTSQSAQGGAGTWAKVQELMNKQQGMQYTSPEKYNKPIEAAAVPKNDEWKSVLMMALNLLGDKGRGMADIQHADNARRKQELDRWDRDNSPQALAQREMQQIQMRNADRQGFEQDRAALGQQAQALAQVANREDAAFRDERDFGRQQERDIAQDTQHQMDKEQQASQFASGQELQREQMRQTAAQQNASRAQAERHFQAQQAQHLLDQDNQLNRDRDAAAERARAREEGYEHDTTLAKMKAEADAAKYNLEHPAMVAPEGWRVREGQEQQFKQAMGNNGVFKEILSEAGNYNQIQKSIDTLIDLRKQPSSEANRRLYDATIKSLIGDRSQEGSTGVLSGTEFERYIADLPKYGELSNLSSMRGIYDSMRFKNPAEETLTGFKKIYHDKQGAKMMPYGIELDEETPAADAPQEQAETYIRRYPGLSLVK
jgi:hypothetical protein